jgi:hypothetical protein
MREWASMKEGEKWDVEFFSVEKADKSLEKLRKNKTK